MIHKGLTEKTVETLMVEYYQLEDNIVKQLEQPVIRTFLFNDIAVSDTYDKALPLLLACYRQRQIKLILQGRDDAGSAYLNDDRELLCEFLDTEYERLRIRKD